VNAPHSVALRPENEAPRRSWQTKRGTTNFITCSTDDDNLSNRRAQRLSQIFGLPTRRARLVAELAWGGARG